MYLVCYDIESDSLRRKLAKTLEDYGVRVQYSVFECNLTEKRYRQMYADILKLSNELKNGSVRIYYVCERCVDKRLVIGETMKRIFRDDEDVIII